MADSEEEDVLMHLEDQQDFCNLTDALLKMVNHVDFSDIEFVCKGGGKVYACRLLLAARCRVLESMLSNGMAESKLTQIPLPAITAAGLVPTLEFLYTGRVVKHGITLETAFDVLEAARFLLLDRLEEDVVDALKEVVLKVTSPRVLACHLSRALEFSLHHSRGEGVQHKVRCLRYGYQDSSYPYLHTAKGVQHMVSCLRNCEDSRSFLEHMSWEAMQVYLELTRTRNLEPVLSFKEYLRLRDILLWVSSRVSSDAAKVMMHLTLPDEAFLSQHFESMKSYTSTTLLMSRPGLGWPGLNFTIVVDYMARNRIDWWEFVSLECIHPVILLRVVEPLGVILPSLLEKALFFQAVHSGNMNVMKWVLGKHSDHYELTENGTLLVAKETGSRQRVFVRANMAFNKTKGIYEFDVLIEELGKYMSIGVGGIKPYSGSPYRDRSGHLVVVPSCSGTLRFVDGQGGVTRTQTVLLNNSHVRVHVDMGKRCCTFSVNGQPLPGIVQSGLDEEVLPFACCESPGRMRILLVTNADFM